MHWNNFTSTLSCCESDQLKKDELDRVGSSDEAVRTIYKVLYTKIFEKRYILGNLQHRWENYIKMIHKELEHESKKYSPVVGCCEYDTEPTGTKEGSQVVIS